MDMYEARQNKEKVSRRIDGGGGMIHNIGINTNTYFKALNVCRNSLAKKNIQMKDPRAANPYERGNAESPKVHHIISHSKLKKAIEKLTEEKQNEVKCKFLPDFKSLTFRQLKKISPKMEVKIEDSALDVSLESLQENITIHDERYGFNITLSAWRDEYEKVKRNDNDIKNNSHLEFWKDLKNSYFEWSGGNLFYGPQERVEPGVTNLDEFDEDAKYFRDPSHVDKLRLLDKRLDQDKNTENVLSEIGELNRNLGAGPKHNPQKWICPNPQHYFLIGSILGSDKRADYFKNNNNKKAKNKGLIDGYLPKDLLKEKIGSWINKTLNTRKCRAALHSYRSSALSEKPLLPILQIDAVEKRKLGRVLKITGIHTHEIITFPKTIKNKDVINEIAVLLKREVYTYLKL